MTPGFWARRLEVRPDLMGAGMLSGGQPEFIPHLPLAAIAAGADAIFLEVHDKPKEAKSDPATVYPLAELPKLLDRFVEVAHAVASGCGHP